MTDSVNRPAHYNQGDVECIDALRSMLTPDEFRAHCKACAQGYIWREKLKNGDEDLQKAVWYLRMAMGNDPRKTEERIAQLQDAYEQAKEGNPNSTFFQHEKDDGV